MILSFAVKLTRNKEDAEDLVQRAYMRVLKHRDKYDSSKGKPSTWICAIMKNLYVSDIRHEKLQGIVLSLDEEEHSIHCPSRTKEPVTNAEQDYLMKNVLNDSEYASLHSMRREHSRALLLDMLNYNYDEISKIEMVALGTVKSRINRGRVTMRRSYRG